MKMNLNRSGFRLRSILVHSLWITAVGVFLFRLATANTQKQIVYVRFFAISGAILAAAPWVAQLIVSAMIIGLYNAGVRDLTWIVRPATEEGRRAVDPRVTDQRGRLGLISRNRGVKIEGSNNNCPKLQRNRTV